MQFDDSAQFDGSVQFDDSIQFVVCSSVDVTLPRTRARISSTWIESTHWRELTNKRQNTVLSMFNYTENCIESKRSIQNFNLEYKNNKTHRNTYLQKIDIHSNQRFRLFSLSVFFGGGVAFSLCMCVFLSLSLSFSFSFSPSMSLSLSLYIYIYSYIYKNI